MTAWFKPRNFALFLGFLICSSFPKVVTCRETFFYRDFILFCYPWAAFHRYSFWRGVIPLWNPFNDCGVPFLAQWNTMVLYPFSIIYIIFPISWAVGIFNLGHLFLAGMGMYFLANHWVGNRPAACVAGVAYVCNGVTLQSVMWTNYIAALAWMPWVVLLAQKAWQQGTARNIVFAGLVGATEVLSGGAEPVIFTWGVVGLLWLVDLVRGGFGRGRQFSRLSAVVGLVVGLTAAQMLPFFDLLQHSQRNLAGFGDARWAMPTWGWANFILPLFRCSPSILGVFSQEKQQFFSSYYLGIGVLALALVAVWQRRQTKVYLLASLAVVGVLLAMGENTPVYVWLRKILPLIKLIRFPIKFVVLTAFALPLLAALGLEGVIKTPKSGDSTVIRSIIIIGVALLLVLVGVLGYAKWFPTPSSSWAVTLESGTSRAVFLMLILGAVGFLCRSTSARASGLGTVVLILLVALDGLTHTTNQNPTVTTACYGAIGIKQEVMARQGGPRAMVHPRLQAILSHAATQDPVRYCSGIRHALYMDCNLIDRIPMITGFFPLIPQDYAQVDSLVNGPRKEPPPALMDFMGVSQISSPDTSFTWNERTNYMPLATAGQLPVFAAPDKTLQALSSPRFDPRASVFLPLEARSSISVTNRSAARVARAVFLNQSVDLNVSAPEPAMVVVAQTFYHNWRASVDGVPTKLWQANYAFQAVEVPAGEHRVRLVYEDMMFKWGTIISLSTLTLCFIALATSKQKTFSSPSVDSL